MRRTRHRGLTRALAVVASGKLWERAIGLLQKMLYQLLILDVASFSTAMSSCEKVNRWQDSLGLLQEVLHQLLTPDLMS